MWKLIPLIEMRYHADRAAEDIMEKISARRGRRVSGAMFGIERHTATEHRRARG
jgi:hypothetical protein